MNAKTKSSMTSVAEHKYVLGRLLPKYGQYLRKWRNAELIKIRPNFAK